MPERESPYAATPDPSQGAPQDRLPTLATETEERLLDARQLAEREEDFQGEVRSLRQLVEQREQARKRSARGRRPDDAVPPLNVRPGAPTRSDEGTGPLERRASKTLEPAPPIRAAAGSTSAAWANPPAPRSARDRARADAPPSQPSHPSAAFYRSFDEPGLDAITRQRLDRTSLAQACMRDGLAPRCVDAAKECGTDLDCANWLKAVGGIGDAGGGSAQAGRQLDSFASPEAERSRGDARRASGGGAGAQAHKVQSLGALAPAGPQTSWGYIASAFASMPPENRNKIEDYFNTRCIAAPAADAVCQIEQICVELELYAECRATCSKSPSCKQAFPATPPLTLAQKRALAAGRPPGLAATTPPAGAAAGQGAGRCENEPCPVDCVGRWWDCHDCLHNGLPWRCQEFSISVPARHGGRECEAGYGSVRACQ
ncbi:MAG: hypothetical protein HY554_05670 [Elusimicrobia bacterium]|nr:hypothetical protein [Elusimicrobiota bacterium]